MNRRGKAYRGDGELAQDEDQLMEYQFEIKTDICGYLNVFVKGDLDNLQPSSLVFLTVHDLGTNHEDFHKLLEHPCMARVKQRSVWIHVDMPGQEYDAIDLAPYFDFPTLDQISEDLVQILDYFSIDSCVTFGEGAGANILLRMAINHPDRVMGNILIHCQPTNDSNLVTYFKNEYNLWRFRVFGMNKTTDNFLVQHKFGLSLNAKMDLDTEQSIKQYLEQLHKRINRKNLLPFIRAYLGRSNIATKIKNELIVPTLIVSGSYPRLQRMADEMQSLIDNKILTRWNALDCSSVLDEATDLFVEKLILFCQGLGYLANEINRKRQRQDSSEVFESTETVQNQPDLKPIVGVDHMDNNSGGQPMANGKSIKLTNGSVGDSNRYNQSMNGSGNANASMMTRHDDRPPIDLIDDNSDDLYNDSYMDIDSDPATAIGAGSGGLYSPMMMMSHLNCSQPQPPSSLLSSSNWDDGILMGPDSGCINGSGGGAAGPGNMPLSQRQQLMAKLMHQDFFNKFDDLLDNDDLD